MRVIALGPGEADGVPALALEAVAAVRGTVFAPPLDAAVALMLGRHTQMLPDDLRAVPADAVVAAPDAIAHAVAVAHPDAHTLPARDVLRARAIGARVAELAVVAPRLRAECPWDRVQTLASIVPHTVEEAFEVAEAVAAGDPAHQADEIGDLLFQSVFLAALLEEDGHADLATVARGQADKLISRHPHVYGDQAAADADAVVDIWEQRKRAERPDESIFHELPPGLPALAYAAKTQKRASSAGFTFPDVAAAFDKWHEEVGEARVAPSQHAVGDVIFAAVAVAQAAGVDPELAVRAAAVRFRARVEGAAAMAAQAGEDFESLGPDAQLEWYRRVRGR